MKGRALMVAMISGLWMLLLGTAAHADKLKDVTCEQFLAMDESQQDDIVYWISGVEAGTSSKEPAAADVEVGFDIFGQPVAEVVTACKADKKASLWDKIREHF